MKVLHSLSVSVTAPAPATTDRTSNIKKEITPTERRQRKAALNQSEIFAKNHRAYFVRIQNNYKDLREKLAEKVDAATATLDKLDREYADAPTVIFAMEQSLKRIAKARTQRLHEPQIAKLMKLRGELKRLEAQISEKVDDD